jgi:hypothetical protein
MMAKRVEALGGDAQYRARRLTQRGSHSETVPSVPPARSIDALWAAIGSALHRFGPVECANYLVNSGYRRSA